MSAARERTCLIRRVPSLAPASPSPSPSFSGRDGSRWCGSFHPLKLPPPLPRWALTWQLSCAEEEKKKLRVGDSERARSAGKTPAKPARPNRTSQRRAWRLWAAQSDGRSLWRSTGKPREWRKWKVWLLRCKVLVKFSLGVSVNSWLPPQRFGCELCPDSRRHTQWSRQPHAGNVNAAG